MTVGLLLASLAVIIVGAEALVRGASRLALSWGVPPLFVGLTIVGFGTSSPELAASVIATLRGATGVSVGNVIGSNIFNVAAILGATALIRPITVRLMLLRRDLLVAVAASAVPFTAAALGGWLPRWLGAVLLGGLAVYLFSAYRAARRAGRLEDNLADAEGAQVVPPSGAGRPGGVAANAALLSVGLILLVLGARVFVDAAMNLAGALEWSERVVGLTVVAVGTSLPELATSVVAGIRRNTDIAVGNVIGSNIFNALGILGVSAVVRPQTMAPGTLTVDVPLMLVCTLALLPIMKTGGCVSRLEGALLLVGYGIYLGFLLVR